MAGRGVTAARRHVYAMWGWLAAGGLVCATAQAQQGHPLVGSWSGDWGTSATERHRVLVLLSYDGERVAGVINPGRGAVELTSATLDPSDWTVRLEASPSPQNDNTHYLIEGRIENLGSITDRTIAGTWVQGTQRGNFRIVMN